ncbi:hypothetical protein, partial [Sabulibacter ruber]|uniref:hypothetical protein n=1 Tax=Sabulibacter ruber TaxID=2811901 RepID=UPI001A96A1E9
VIPPQDYGKTTGVIIALNNLSQPLAGLAVSVFSASFDGTRSVIAAFSLFMGIVGVLLAMVWRREARLGTVSPEAKA